MAHHHRSLLTASLLLITSIPVPAQNITDTRLLWQPAISKNQIAFIYAEDLWVALMVGCDNMRVSSGFIPKEKDEVNNMSKIKLMFFIEIRINNKS